MGCPGYSVSQHRVCRATCRFKKLLFGITVFNCSAHGEESKHPTFRFFEDAALEPVEKGGNRFHLLLGVAEDTGMMMHTNPLEADWLNGMQFGFDQLGRSKRDLESVRIYVHKVPRCSGEELLDHYMVDQVSSSPSRVRERVLHMHAQHIASVHFAILNSPNIVSDPLNATVFYIPAFFSLLIERWMDTGNPSTLNCISRAWMNIPDEFLVRNAGFDHFIIAGTCHPFYPCDTMECDVTSYHPVAINVMVLTGGIREYGHLQSTFKPGAVYSMLKFIFIPFPAALDCERLAQLSLPSHNRSVFVSFIGSENSRIRHMFRKVVENPDWEYADDARLSIHILDDDLVIVPSAVFGDSSLWKGRWSSALDLYEDSELCLVLPGHIYDFSRRGFDVIARGCIPVVVTLAPMFVSLPFASQLPWNKFAVFVQVQSEADIAVLLHQLVSGLGTVQGQARVARRREVLQDVAPRLFLPPLSNCLNVSFTAADSIVNEFTIRQAAWAAIRSSIFANSHTKHLL